MSDSFRRMAADALGERIRSEIQLQEPPTIISAPPSDVGEYPTVAIWLERFVSVFSQEEELEVDADGELRHGARMLLEQPAGAATIAEGTQLSRVGTLRGSGRIWVGSRLPAKREQIESKISRLFTSDSGAIGRLMLEIQHPTIDDIVIPWTWPIAAFVGDVQWTDEYAFSERLWAWIEFEMEIDLVVPRTDPLMTSIVIGLLARFSPPTPPIDPVFEDAEPMTLGSEI